MSQFKDCGWRVEVRAESPDPSVPSGGQLYAYATRNRTGGGWAVHHRDGSRVVVATRTEALLTLGRFMDDAQGGGDRS